MMWWFYLLSWCLTLASCRPQTNEPSVELEKQTIVELKTLPDHTAQPTQRKIEADTKEILEKIAEVNKKQGLTSRKQKPNYFHFPFSYYSRSQEGDKKQERQSSDFRFNNNPFVNPIFQYLETDKQEVPPYLTNYDFSNSRESQIFPYQQEISMNQPNIENSEDVPKGQYVKRKIVHQQTFLVPNSNLLAPQSYAITNINENQPNEKILSNLEKQTVDNVKNIVTNSQVQPVYYNPYAQYIYPNQVFEGSNNIRYGFVNPERTMLGQINNFGRQNWNWPGANYFPIHIRDPFLQMYNAITSMIEYGPNAGMQNPCPGRPIKKATISEMREGKTLNDCEERREDKSIKDSTKSIDSKIIHKNNTGHTGTKTIGDNIEYIEGKAIENITEKHAEKISEGNIETEETQLIETVDSSEEKRNKNIFDIKSIDVGADKDDSLRVTVSLNTSEREGKGTVAAKNPLDRIRIIGKSNFLTFNNSARISNDLTKPGKDLRPSTILKTTLPTKATILSPPTRDPTHQTNEFGEESLDEKSEEVMISNDGNKKFFSKDNTGSGVFIHKLRVRTGGVAIAGPGGIATAGSGGTAIVGPNGFAYTHPDSLAIAGSGTKVVAVDPKINLRDIVRNTTLGNNTMDKLFPSRVGKVVAVGPVIYYNRGDH